MYLFAGIVALIAVLIGGYMLGRASVPKLEPTSETAAATVAASADTTQWWTCSMHPQVRQPGPGRCPICAMELIPVSGASSEEGDRAVLSVSETAKALMGVQTTLVERRFVEAEVRMVGRVAYDETRLATITAWVPGRIERMYVDFTGVPVRQGDHLVQLYSPELMNAQEELRRAVQAAQRLSGDTADVVRRSTEAMVTAAKDKLRRWGLTERQVEDAAAKGAFSEEVTIYAPVSGTVIERNGVEGMYVETGTPIYAIADLSEVWVKFDAYESDLPWLRYGQHVQFTAEAHPGETFDGQIIFIDPVLDPRTRTVRVRVNVENKAGKLKPDMFVRGVVRARVAGKGKVIDPSLTGKWISPMHPEIVKDGPGTCDVCGMPLVPAEELGYMAADEAGEAPLVIPATVPLITGTRAVVYVQVPDAEMPTFEGREVVLGPRAGDYYIVESGLDVGDRVVTEGNFKIDSALQILAKPSMMSAESVEESAPGTQTAAADPALRAPASGPPDLQRAVRAAYDSYVPLQQALAQDDGAAAGTAAKDALAALERTASSVEGTSQSDWREFSDPFREGLQSIADAPALDAMRQPFANISKALLEAVEASGIAPGQPVYIVHCPMAFDFAGARWLQPTEEVANPYFGKAMQQCGTIERQLVPAAGD
jgi:Cu(I)/Ag(I) efflux system membrane fusion protein